MMWTVIIGMFLVVQTVISTKPPAQVVYEWVSLDYDWPNSTAKTDYISEGKFIKENNILAGVKVHKGDVYVTVPRWLSGIPSSLNKVVVKNGKPILQPFPDWESQTIGDCNALQYIQSMEIDPKRGWMWIIDIGRINILPGSTPRNICPPKLVIYDINNRRYVRRHVFPASVASPESNFLNDIVVDVIDDKPSYAYITDTSFTNPGLVVYNFQNDSSHRFSHPSMGMEADATNITINHVTYNLGPAGIDGIALSSNSKFVYYCAVSAFTLYQVPTVVVRNPGSDFAAAVRSVGEKVSQSDGLTYGQNNLYYGALDRDGLYKWQVTDDAKDQDTFSKIQMRTQTPLFENNVQMTWVDTFGFDENGYLWFTANSLQPFFQQTLDFSDNKTSANFRIWKVYVGERGYLDHNNDVLPIIIG